MIRRKNNRVPNKPMLVFLYFMYFIGLVLWCTIMMYNSNATTQLQLIK